MTVIVTADKGGVGKTTLAYHLAARMAQQGVDVGLIDLDPRRGSWRWAADSGQRDFPVYRDEDIAEAAPEHVVCVYDTPAHSTVAMQESYAAADLVLIVCEPGHDALFAAMEMYRDIVGWGGRPRVVLNKVHPTGGEGPGILDDLRANGIAVIEPPVRQYRAYLEAEWTRRTVAETPHASADKAWSDIAAVAEAVGAVLSEEVACA